MYCCLHYCLLAASLVDRVSDCPAVHLLGSNQSSNCCHAAGPASSWRVLQLHLEHRATLFCEVHFLSSVCGHLAGPAAFACTPPLRHSTHWTIFVHSVCNKPAFASTLRLASCRLQNIMRQHQIGLLIHMRQVFMHYSWVTGRERLDTSARSLMFSCSVDLPGPAKGVVACAGCRVHICSVLVLPDHAQKPCVQATPSAGKLLYAVITAAQSFSQCTSSRSSHFQSAAS